MRSESSSPVLCVGELLWDLLPSGPRLGGATTNFSVLTARLGDTATLVSRIGQDELGHAALDSLQPSSISGNASGSLDLSRIQVSTNLPTGTVGVALDPHGKPSYTIEQPVAWDQVELEPALMDLAGKASALYFGTLIQRQAPSRQTLQALVQATQPNCTRVCDINLRMPCCTPETLHWSLRHATVLKVSDEELPQVFSMLGLPIHFSAGRVAEAAAALLDCAPECKLVAITLGPEGSYLASRTGGDRHAGIPTKVVDTIGAGDAFTAGMVHAYLRGATLPQINSVSNLCGSYVASQPGATPEFPPELLDKLRLIVGT